ncbi:MAG: hypothetical protein IJ493_12525 [Clostridia bacterium]|nr:hypothetical protein [Clostridia bacterium]
MTDYTFLGRINFSYLEIEFGKLQTDEVIITNERLHHIQERHPEDYDLFFTYSKSIILSPDIVLLDSKNAGTVFFVKSLDGSNLNIVIRVALETDAVGRKNSVMTFYRIRDKNLKKLENKSKTLYKRE